MPVLYPRYRHSPSAANLYIADPAAFVWRYGLERWGEMEARPAMGLAAERAIAHALTGGADDIGALARRFFDEIMEGEIFDEREHAAAIAEQFLSVLAPLSRPTKYQHTVTTAADGLSREIKAVLDLEIDGVFIDLKATLRMPSLPKTDHLRQVGVYWKLTSQPQSLLYATPKKVQRFDISVADCENGWADALDAFRRIERLDAAFPTAQAALDCLPIATDNYRLDAATIMEIRRNG